MAITASALQKIQARSRDMWYSGNMRNRYNADVEVMEAIIAAQGQVRIEPLLTNRDKDLTVRLWWPNLCDVAVSSCTNICTFTGPEADTDAKDYAITQCKEAKMKFAHDIWRTNEARMEEMVAEFFVKADMTLSEEIAQDGVTALESFAGTLPYLGPNSGADWGFTAGTGETEYTITDEMPLSLILWKLRQAGKRAKMGMPIVVSGDSGLAQALYVATTNQMNLDGKGEFARFTEIRDLYFDLINIPEVVDDYRTYLIDQGAMAFVSKNRFGPQPEVITGPAGRVRFTRRSNILPYLTYDVEMQTSCDEAGNGGAGDLYDFYKVIARYDFFQNPVGCEDPTATGIYAFSREITI